MLHNTSWPHKLGLFFACRKASLACGIVPSRPHILEEDKVSDDDFPTLNEFFLSVAMYESRHKFKALQSNLVVSLLF